MPDRETLITEDQFRQTFSIPSDIGFQAIRPALFSASSQIKADVGDVAYADARNETPANQKRADDLKLAETYLAMSLAFPLINNRPSPDGNLVSGKAADGTQMQYLKPDEMAKGADYFAGRAALLVAPYLIAQTETPAALPVMATLATGRRGR